MITGLYTAICFFSVLAAIMQLALLADQTIHDSPLTGMGRRIKVCGYLVVAVVAVTEISTHGIDADVPMLIAVLAIAIGEVFHAANRLFAHYIEETTGAPKRHENFKHRH